MCVLQPCCSPAATCASSTVSTSSSVRVRSVNRTKLFLVRLVWIFWHMSSAITRWIRLEMLSSKNYILYYKQHLLKDVWCKIKKKKIATTTARTSHCFLRNKKKLWKKMFLGQCLFIDEWSLWIVKVLQSAVKLDFVFWDVGWWAVIKEEWSVTTHRNGNNVKWRARDWLISNLNYQEN